MEETIQTITNDIGKALKYRRFAFPSRLIEPYREKLAELGVSYSTKKVRIGDVAVPACIFYGVTPLDRLEVYLSIACVMGKTLQESVMDSVIAQSGKSRVQLFVGKKGTVSINQPEEDEEGSKVLKKPAYACVRRALDSLSGFMGGIDITFFDEDREASYPPLPDQSGHINIFPWSAPPGARRTEYIDRIFGLHVDRECNSILTFKDVPGRGTVIRDENNAVAQTIGNNWYLLFSVIEYFNEHTTAKILHKVFGALLAVHGERVRRVSDTHKRFNRDALLEHVTRVVLCEGPAVEKLIRERERAAERLRKELLETERAIADYKRLGADTQEGPHVQAILATIPAQLARIRANRYVEGGTATKDGFMIFTRPILLTHEGKRYPMGKFTIYFSKSGSFSLWSDRRTHPSGYTHPHINADGTPCLGNARSAIETAVAKHRYADAVDFIIDWLVEGYEHNLAHNKITEWPCEPEDERLVPVTQKPPYAQRIGEEVTCST